MADGAREVGWKFSASATGVVAAIASMRSKFEGLSKQTEGLNSKLGLLGKLNFSSVIRGLTAVGVAASAIGAAKTGINATMAAAERADKIQDLGGRLRLTAEEFQVFGKIAQDGGASVEEIGGAYLKFKLNLQQATSAGGDKLKELNKNLAAFGLTAAQAQKMAPLDLMKKLGSISSASTTDADELLKIEKIRALFGKTGATLIPVIEDIGTSYDQVLAKMRASGTLISAADAEIGAKAFKSIEKAKASLSSIKMRFGITMFPVLEKFAGEFSARMGDIRGQITPTMDRLSKLLLANSGEIVTGIVKVSTAIATLVGWLVKLGNMAGWDKVIFGGALIILSPLIVSVLSLGSTLWGCVVATRAFIAANAAMNAGSFAAKMVPMIASLFTTTGAFSALGITATATWTAILGPLALVVVAIVAAGILIYKYWDQLKAFFIGVWQGFRAAVDPVIDAFGVLWNTTKTLGAALLDIIPGLRSVWSWLVKVTVQSKPTADALGQIGEAGRKVGALLATSVKVALTPLALLADAIGLIVAGVKYLST